MDPKLWDWIYRDENKEANCDMVLEAMFEQQDRVAYYPGSGRKKVDGTKMDAPFYQLLQLVKSKFIPAGHTSGPNAANLYLVYCIKTGRPINIGYWIAGELQTRAFTARRTSLIFPSLIWKLCERAGVNMDMYERDLKMKAPIPFSHHFNLPGTRCSLLELGRPAGQAAEAQNAPGSGAAGRGRGTVPRGRGRGRAQAREDTEQGGPLDLHRLQAEMYELHRQAAQLATDRHGQILTRMNRTDRTLARMIARQEHVYAELLGPRYVQPPTHQSDSEEADSDFEEEAAPESGSD